MTARNRWFVCKGCGGWIGLLAEGLPPYYRPGSVAHSKPAEDVNVRPAQCALYQQSECHVLWALHENEPEIEGPTKMTPVYGRGAAS